MKNMLMFIILALLVMQMKPVGANVDIAIYNIKYKISIASWLTSFLVTEEGYSTCIQLENSCCFLPNQVIKATQITFKNQVGIQFQGPAQGYYPGNCFNNQLKLVIIGSHGDSDFSNIVGKFTYVLDMNTTDGQLKESAKFCFVLAIDDQQNVYQLKLPSKTNTYTDNDSYNFLQIVVPENSATTYETRLSFSFTFILYILLYVIV